MEPAELGRVDVRISVDAAGKAQAHLTADKPQTLQMLQRDSQTLERSLKDAGLNLSNNGLNFSLKGEQQSSTPTFVARNRALSINSVQTIDTVSSTSGTSTAPGDSRLDIRV
jgi:flagellar hook-length control protein FliK